jgi:hypothetical protein
MNANVLQHWDVEGSPATQAAWPRTAVLGEVNKCNSHDFAWEQIRGLVRRVFFASGGRFPKQVAFSAVEAETDVANLCEQAGWALALETNTDVAVVIGDNSLREANPPHLAPRRGTIKSWSTQTAINLWRVSASCRYECCEEPGRGKTWVSFLARLRSEFEYAVIQAPTAGTSSEAALLGQFADGIILVLEAHRTRRAAARTIKKTLQSAQCRILGTVLSERTFPVPERIYRSL